MINSTEVLLVTVADSIVIVLTTFWIWAMVHCARRISAGETRLVGWLIAILERSLTRSLDESQHKRLKTIEHMSARHPL